MKIYIAAPLFNEMEWERNTRVKAFLQDLGFQVHLPQDEAGLSYDLISSDEEKAEVRTRLFESDVEGVKGCDIVVCLLDGRVPDEGTCIELGMAYAWGKICIGYKTDKRAMDQNGDNNIMIDGCIGESCIASTLPELRRMLLDHLRE